MSAQGCASRHGIPGRHATGRPHENGPHENGRPARDRRARTRQNAGTKPARHRSRLGTKQAGTGPTAGTRPGTQISPPHHSETGWITCSPDGIRTRATALRGRRPGPLDDGARTCLAPPPCRAVPLKTTRDHSGPLARAGALSDLIQRPTLSRTPVAGVPGLEPRLTEPESVGLPITPYPIGTSRCRSAPCGTGEKLYPPAPHRPNRGPETASGLRLRASRRLRSPGRPGCSAPRSPRYAR